MRAILLPHTDPPRQWGSILREIFEEVLVYRPLGRPPAEAEGAVVPFSWVAPGGGDVSRLEETVRALSSWAELHHGGAGIAAAWEALRRNEAEDEALPALAARLRGGRQAAEETGDGALLTARALLLLAERADRERREARRLLARGEEGFRRLVAEIAGEPPPAGGNGAGRPETETEEAIAPRLFAWARLFLAQPTEGAVLVTPSRAALDLLEERLPGADAWETPGDCGSEAFASRIRGLLDDVSHGRRPLSRPGSPFLSPAGDPAAPVRLLAWPGIRPVRLFSTLLDPRLRAPSETGIPPRGEGVTVVLRLPLETGFLEARRES